MSIIENADEKILATVLHEIDSSRTVAEWLKHIQDNGHDPAKFFGTNAAGLAEYNQFVSKFNIDGTKPKNGRKKTRKGK
jgi:DNA/RNA-binding domain of Phe-tRNA-synthetase-like protein